MTYPTKKLGEVVEFQYGKGIDGSRRDERGEVPIYGANGVLGWTDKAWTSGEAIIVGRKGSAGELTRVSGKFWPSDVTYYVLGNNQIDIDYLLHFLKSVSLPKLATGVKPGINRNRVYEIEIPVPPIAEQRKIVENIEKQFAKIDEAARKRAEAQALTEKLLPAALHEIFSKLKEQHKSSELGKVAHLVRGPFGGSLKKEIFVPSGYAVYEQGNVIDQELADFRYFITTTKFHEMKRFAVAPGDILMSCSGTIGRFVIIPNNFSQGVINQALLKITPSKGVLPEYLKLALQDYIAESTGYIMGSAIKNIVAVSELKKIKIPLPPLPEQRKIVKKLDALAAKARNLLDLQSSQSTDLKSLKQSILHQVFSAKLNS